MRFNYGEFTGDPFPTPESLFGFDKLMDFLMEYGPEALRAMQQAMKEGDDSPSSDLLEQLLKDGMLDKDGKGRLKLTPRAVNRMQMKALDEVFRNLRQGQRDGHEKLTTGTGGERIDGTKAYEFGDALSDIDLNATLRNAIQRQALEPGGQQLPIRFAERDFEVYQREGTTSVSTCVLIDLSGSMARYGRYMSAKKVALALLALVRQRFPLDTIDFVGFYSGAQKIPEIALPLVMPKPVTIYDYQVRLKCRVDQIEKAPQHFTNLHMGLQMARKILRKRAGENKQIFVITDGQPTAHVEGDFVYLLYPPDPRSTVATLKEAVMASKEGIRINTFALIEDYYGMDWVGFVDQMTRMCKGVAFYTSSGELADCIMQSYLSGKKQKRALRR